MAGKKTVLISAYTAGANIEEYRFLKVTGDYTLAHASAGSYAVGVSEGTAKAGERIDVMHLGIAEVIVGTGGVSAGGAVESDANGKAVALDEGIALGIALESGAVGDIISILIKG
ncbi:MAG: DUF2190 family protein [Campylobacteraceae bacterium]|jgi:hypothetical protein|nr:DUF2190 family protein [Campylobacteraceae bacterium]